MSNTLPRLRAGLLISCMLLPGTGGCSDPGSPASTAETTSGATAAPMAEPLKVSSTGRSGPRNLIMIVVDTLRSDYIGAYGGSVPTPFLDSLAASGVRFERSYSHIPLTGPSHASFFTSSLPSDHGCVVNSQVFDERNVTLAEIVRENGFSTTAIVSLGVLNSRFGFDQGFDIYADSFRGRWWKSADEINLILQSWIARTDLEERVFLMLHYSDPHTPYAPPTATYPDISLRLRDQILTRQLADSRPQRFAITLPPGRSDVYFDLPPEFSRADYGCGVARPSDRRVTVLFPDGGKVVSDKVFLRRFKPLPTAMRLINPTDETLSIDFELTLRVNMDAEDWPDWYAMEVEYVDQQLAVAFEMLDAAGLWENAVVVFTSDHGEGLGEHNHMQHVEQLYDSQLRIPLVMVAPGLLPQGKVVSTPVRHVDILPTLLDLLEIDTDTPFRGSSLLPLIETGRDARPPVVSETHTPEARNDQRSIVYEGFKYIVNMTTGGVELYDLEDDPGELDNIADQRPEMLGKLQRALAAQYEHRYGPGVTNKDMADLSDEDRARLKALGYIR
jgi:arylsulfatase A-like enzyme